jgi:hypothetical protein
MGSEGEVVFAEALVVGAIMVVRGARSIAPRGYSQKVRSVAPCSGRNVRPLFIAPVLAHFTYAEKLTVMFSEEVVAGLKVTSEVWLKSRPILGGCSGWEWRYSYRIGSSVPGFEGKWLTSCILRGILR